MRKPQTEEIVKIKKIVKFYSTSLNLLSIAVWWGYFFPKFRISGEMSRLYRVPLTPSFPLTTPFDMKKHLPFSCLLLTALLVATPATAQDPVHVHNVFKTDVFDTGEDIYAGVLLTEQSGMYATNDVPPVASEPFEGYDLSASGANLVIEITNVEHLLTAAVVARDFQENFTLVHISNAGNSGENGNLFGFLYVSTAPEYSPFGSNINLVGSGTSITVTNETGSATGAGFKNFNGGVDDQKWGALGNTVIYFGDISVKGVGAEGFAAAETSADTKIYLGTITAEGGAADTRGVLLAGNHAGLLNTGNITVKATDDESLHGSAAGIQITGNVASSASIVVDGKISAETASGTVHGIEVKGDVNTANVNVNSIEATSDTMSVGAQFGSISSGTIVIDSIVAKSAATGISVGFGVEGKIEGGTITLGGIIADGKETDGSAKESVGFVSAGGVDGGTIVIDSIAVRGETGAAGFGVGNLQEEVAADRPKTVTGGNITVNNIDVTAKTGTAFGWYSGAVTGGELTLGTTKVTGGGGAAGVYVDGNFAGKLTTGAITVTDETAGAGTVSGINIDGLFKPAEGSTIGTISVLADGTTDAGHAYGIAVTNKNAGENASEFTISKNISVENRGEGQAVGIHVEAGDAVINFTDKLDIRAADGAIRSAGNLTLNFTDVGGLTTENVLNSGANLTIKGTGTATVARTNVGNNLSIEGGRADMGIITMQEGTNLTASGTGTVLELNVAESVLPGTNKIESGAALEVYGDPNLYVNRSVKFELAPNTRFIAQPSRYFFSYAWDPLTNEIYTTINEFSDGFLAAAMIHGRYTAYNMVRDRFISAHPQYRATHYRGQCAYNSTAIYSSAIDSCGTGSCGPNSCTSVPNDPPGGRITRFFPTNTAWVNYVGRGDEYRGWALGNGWKINAEGVQVGTDLWRNRNNQFGVIFGYEDGRAKNIEDRVDSEDIYVGVYSAAVFHGGMDLRAIYNHGWQNFDMLRDGFDSSFKGRTQEITLELGKRFHRGLLSVRPFFGSDVFITHLDSATETASLDGAALAYDKLNMTQVFVRTGFDLRFQQDWYAFDGGLFYAYELNNPSFETRVYSVASRQYSTLLQGSNYGREIVAFHLGTNCEVTDRLSLFGGYNGYVTVDSTGGLRNSGYIGVGLNW